MNSNLRFPEIRFNRLKQKLEEKYENKMSSPGCGVNQVVRPADGIALGQTLLAEVHVHCHASAVSNTYNGTITLQISGLTNGECREDWKFLDANTNGVVDAGDLLVQGFRLTDGQAVVIGGVTNFDVPGDLNATTGAITTTLIFEMGISCRTSLATICSSWPVRGSFRAAHQPVCGHEFSLPANAHGNVVSNSTGHHVVQCHCPAVSSPASGKTTGRQAVRWPAWWRTMRAATLSRRRRERICRCFQGQLCRRYDRGAGAHIGRQPDHHKRSDAHQHHDQHLRQRGDANNSSHRMPGVLVPAMSDNGACWRSLLPTPMAISNVPVNAGTWGLSADDTGLIVHGYLGLQNGTNVNAGATGVTLAVPRGTALIYGSVMDNLGNPMAGIDVYCYDNNNYLYQTDGLHGHERELCRQRARRLG